MKHPSTLYSLRRLSSLLEDALDLLERAGDVDHDATHDGLDLHRDLAAAQDALEVFGFTVEAKLAKAEAQALARLVAA